MNEQKKLSINPRMWWDLLQAGHCEPLCGRFVGILMRFRDQVLAPPISPQERRFIDLFVENFLNIFCSPTFVVPPKAINVLLGLHPTITNVVALSSFQTTRQWLLTLGDSPLERHKAMVLYNARHPRSGAPAKFFAADPGMASKWWSAYWSSANCMVDSTTYQSLVTHAAETDERLVLKNDYTRAAYFFASYFSDTAEKKVKTTLNRLSREKMSRAVIRNHPDPHRIAVISGKWTREHAVHKSIKPLVDSLAGHYHLTLVHLGAEVEGMDTEQFDEVLHVKQVDGRLDLKEVEHNRFGLAFYPDIGMNLESVLLSNVRLAPIQVTAYGHPCSTRGSAIDYFIGGRAVELPEKAAENYSERLVCIPGIGAHPVLPPREPAGLPLPDGPLRINCSWSMQKINYPMVGLLQRILARSDRPIRFQLFASGKLMLQGTQFAVLYHDLVDALGEKNVLPYCQMPYEVYMKSMGLGAFALDAYPFGGYNTVLDSLYLGKPIVTLQGTQAANRLASAVLKQFGLDELVAESEDHYVERTLRLIDDTGYRDSLVQRIGQLRIKERLAGAEHPEAFRRAIDYLIENHQSLLADTDRSPIFID